MDWKLILPCLRARVDRSRPAAIRNRPQAVIQSASVMLLPVRVPQLEHRLFVKLAGLNLQRP